MNPQTLAATLGALRKAGSVFGVLFTNGERPLFSDLAYTPERVEGLNRVLADIASYFEQAERRPEMLAFSFDGGSLVILLRGEHRLVVLHHHADEADFIAKAGGAFFTDYFASLAAARFTAMKEQAAAVAATPPAKPVQMSAIAGHTAPISPRRPPVDPTTPIQPTAAV